MVTEDIKYNFGGDWIRWTTSDALLDVRDINSTDPDRSFNWERTLWKFFPIFSYWNTRSDTQRGISTEYQVHVRFLTILGVLSVCVLLVQIFRCIGARMGRKVLEIQPARIAMITVLFFACAAGAFLTPSTSVSRSSTTSYPNLISAVYPIEELRAIAHDPDKAIEWSAEILTMYPDDQQGVLLLGQFRIFDDNADKSTREMEYEVYQVGIGYQFNLFIWVRATYGQEVAEREFLQHQSRVTRAYRLQSVGALTHIWGTLRSKSYIQIRVVHLVLIGVSFYWMWVVFQWGGRLVLGRVQRRRVLRNQCIFCRYPLTEMGITARSTIKST